MTANAKESPKVCICVPTFNSGRTLPETLDSILGQTCRDLAVLVVDNASADNTAAVAESYAARDGRVRVLRNAENVGAEGNFTRCLSAASGQYTALFHADDVYTPEIVARMAAFLDAHPQAGAVFSMAQQIDAEGKPGRVYSVPAELKGREEFGFGEIFRTVLKYGNFLFCPGVMARTEVYRDYIRVWDAGGFNTSADLDVWFRILLKHNIGIIGEPLLRYRGAAVSSYSYAAARTKTAPHDMIKVLAAYVEGPAAGLMGEKERTDFSLLILKDDINRAFNCFVSGARSEARALLGGLFKPANILHALGCSFHLRTVVYGYAVYSMACVPLPAAARNFIFKLRFR